MAARGLSAGVASSAALVISLLLAALTLWYYRINVHPPVSAGYGFYIGVGGGSGCGRVLGVGMVAAMVGRRAGHDRLRRAGHVDRQRWVSLEPLTRDHVPEIAAAAADGDVGSLWFTGAPSPQTAAAVGGHAARVCSGPTPG